MKSGIIFSLLLISQISFAMKAKKYELLVNLSINGKNIVSPAMTITEGNPTTVTQKTSDGNFFLTATTMSFSEFQKTYKQRISSKKAIPLAFVIGKFEVDGKETILSNPGILATDGKMASITQGLKDKKESIFLSVIAKEVKK